MLSIDELANEIFTFSGHINAANHRWLMLIAEFDRRNGWNDGSTQSCAHWLNWKCGLAMGAAREKVRVAHALEKLPKISAAMERGNLSYSKVREITRVASTETEDYFLQIAEHGTAQHVEKLVQAYRRCKDAEELSREARQQESRRVYVSHDDDGSLVLHCVLPADAGARILKALDLALEALPPVDAPKDVPAGTSLPRVPFSMRRADALVVVADSFLAQGAIEARGTDTHQIVVHVAEETLRDKTAGCCEFEQGPSMAAETARRFACDASVVHLVENADGETKPSNLVSLCRFHHRAVHEGGFTIQRLDDGAFRFVRPNGTAVAPDCTQPPGDWKQLPPGVPVMKWRGERMDYGQAIDALLQQSKRDKNVPAGTSTTQ